MPIISQGLTLPANVQTGGTIQASDVATLYSAMNALSIPGTIGVWQQGFVDNNVYTSTGSNGFVDWAFTSASNKAILFITPFSWTGNTGNNVLANVRISGVSASTDPIVLGSTSSGTGLIVGFINPVSTAVTKAGFVLSLTDRSAATLNANFLTVTQSTADRTSMGFITTSTTAATITWAGVRFWVEG